MYCPNCEAEYRAEVTRCYDCDVDLVESLPDAEPAGPFASVFRSADASLLPVVKSVLRGAGIRFVVQGDEAHGLYPFGPAGSGPDGRLLGAHVLVPEADVDAARSLLKELEGGEGEEE